MNSRIVLAAFSIGVALFAIAIVFRPTAKDDANGYPQPAGVLTAAVGEGVKLQDPILGTTGDADVLPAPSMQRKDVIVAIGDIHGDFRKLIDTLKLMNLVRCDVEEEEHTKVERSNDDDEMPLEELFSRCHWSGDETTLVQCGDLVDRGPDDFLILRYMERLRGEALSVGGKVVTLLGNHELLNLMGQYHYVHRHATPACCKERNDLFDAVNGEYGKLLMSAYNVTYVAYDTLFVHAGLLPKFVPDEGLSALDSAVKAAILARRFQAAVLSSSGPLWTREIIGAAAAGDCAQLTETLSKLGLQRMVVGHTIQKGIRSFCDDALIAIDVGMSKWIYDREPQALRFFTDASTGETHVDVVTASDGDA